ncbi:MAG: acetyl-CoA C-acetyltransferase [Flavobacteriales bacterium]|nr:acetyl-CoA C-acetyltransferase [Flavobacteriales bacterium]
MNAYIYDAIRTPRGKGKKDGSLHEVRPVSLLSGLLKEIPHRNGLSADKLEDVIMGCVTQVRDQSGDIAMAAAIDAGYPDSASAVTLNRFCGSGLEAVNQAAALVNSGQAGFAVAGGVESMSRNALGSDGAFTLIDPLMITSHRMIPQGVSADLIASKYGYSRADLDAFSAESHRRAAQAWTENRFAKGIVPVRDNNGKIILDRDETIRPETTVEKLAELKPSFEMQAKMAGFDSMALQRYPEVEELNYFHHAGNSSGIVDGAAAVLIGTKEAGEAAGIKPRARIRSFAVVGTEHVIMLTGPYPASQKALKHAGMTFADIDLFEVNEAFAVVPMLFMDQAGVSADRVNVNGGAIAMGHPLGATGAILLGTVLDELERTGKSTGLVTLCIGGGMGIATVIERV